MTYGRIVNKVALAAILLVALGLRFYNLGFGLPSLYDPDEPLFIMKGVELLTDGTLNPRWFGHPGTTTIYFTSLTTIGVVGWGIVIGSWSSIDGFTHAAFANPGLLFYPVRVVMALIAVLCVWMTYNVANRLHGNRVALLAFGLLAINALHVSWSQVIRTDINASLFMLAALYFAIRIARHGDLRDYLWAGVLTGISVATKWPAASIFIAVCGASMARLKMGGTDWRAEIRKLAAASLASLAAIFLASPFLVLDWQTVMADLSGEARPVHLGHTGFGFLGNLAYYLQSQVAGTMGWFGLFFVLMGAVLSARSSTAARYTLVPAAIAFLVTISAQKLIWSRWILPLMPMFSIFAAVGIVRTSNWLSERMPVRRPWLLTALALSTIIPSLWMTVGAIRQRQNDTRAMAAKWAVQHFPAGSSVAIEHLELRLRDQDWKILFPIGEAGCIDGVRALEGGFRYDDVNQRRNGIPIVDLGNVGLDKLDSCRADFAILTYYDLYKQEAQSFPHQVATYERLLANGRTVALFRPDPGRSGGPIVRIVELPQR